MSATAVAFILLLAFASSADAGSVHIGVKGAAPCLNPVCTPVCVPTCRTSYNVCQNVTTVTTVFNIVCRIPQPPSPPPGPIVTRTPVPAPTDKKDYGRRLQQHGHSSSKSGATVFVTSSKPTWVPVVEYKKPTPEPPAPASPPPPAPVCERVATNVSTVTTVCTPQSCTFIKEVTKTKTDCVIECPTVEPRAASTVNVTGARRLMGKGKSAYTTTVKAMTPKVAVPAYPPKPIPVPARPQCEQVCTTTTFKVNETGCVEACAGTDCSGPQSCTCPTPEPAPPPSKSKKEKDGAILGAIISGINNIITGSG